MTSAEAITLADRHVHLLRPTMTTKTPVMTELPQRTVLLVEDHDLVRLGTCVLIASIAEVSCHVIPCRSLDEARQACTREPMVDLVLLDLNLCDAKGLQGLRCMREEFPSLPIAVLTGTQDEFVIRQAQAMGAAGFILKSWMPDQIVVALKALLHLDERTPLMSGSTIYDRFPKLAGTSHYDRVAELGTRHIEILELVLSGCSNQEIAVETSLSLGTVKNYVSAILLALDVKSRAHLISLFH
ncbi:response regulator transcription factor [soil metagenome]